MDSTVTEYSGGHRYKFVSDIPDSLDCFLCHLPSRDPVLTTCGYNACQICLEEYKRSVRPSGTTITAVLACPKCLDYDFKAYPNKMSNRDLFNLHVYCNNNTAGCKWSGRLNDLNTHLQSSNGCLFEMISCPRSCGIRLLRGDVASHCKNVCPLLVINCPHCFIRGEKRFIEGQHLEECSKAPVICPNNCGIGVANQSLIEHRQTCPLQVVPCEFSMFGCDTIITRQESDVHNKSNTTKHLALVKDRLTTSTIELQSSKAKLMKLKEKLNNFESAFSYSIIEVLSMVRLLDTLDSTKQKQEICNLQKQISLCHQSLLFLPSHQVAPVTLKMNDFTRHRNDGSNWFSIPFYTHKDGYRLSLCVVAAGCDSAKGSHMSVFVCLMKGVHDDELVWPMDGFVEIHLLNQLQTSDSTYYMTIAIPDTPLFPLQSTMRVLQDYSKAYKTPSGWRNSNGIGVRNFILLSKLDKPTATCQFIKDDCVFFRVEYHKSLNDVGSPRSGISKRFGRTIEQGSLSGSPQSYQAPQDVPLMFKDDEALVARGSPVIQQDKPEVIYKDNKLTTRYSPLVKRLIQENKLTQEGSKARFIPETDTEL